MIFLDKITEELPPARKLVEGSRKIRVHKDVVDLAYELVKDKEKLLQAAPYLFMPAYDCWIEWEDSIGVQGVYFHGGLFKSDKEKSVKKGYGFWCFQQFGVDHKPGYADLNIDLEQGVMRTKLQEDWDLATVMRTNTAIETVKLYICCILALINSPKLIRQQQVDVSRINKKRTSLGRYTFHPHHEVRLNIDKRIITTVAGHSDGSSRSLHFVRTHLRLVPTQGCYTLVKPHWRGDPALGIRDTHYRADRQNSRWAE